MTKKELEKIMSDAEKYDNEATIDQIKYNLDSSIIEYIDTFGYDKFKNALNKTLKESKFVGIVL